MHRIKHKLKSVQVKIDDKLGNPFVYSYQKTLFKLSLVLLVAVFLVIRGCTIPLLVDNQLTRFLFYSDGHGDKTLYNIAISVIAAYIFYLVQVYIPEKTQCKKKINMVSQANQHQIFILEQFIKAWQVFLNYQDDIFFCEFKEFQYNTNHGGWNLTKESYKETIEELTDNLDRILNHPKFDEFDTSYQELICTQYYKLDGFRKCLLDILPDWAEEKLILSKREYDLLKEKFREFSRFSKRLQHIEKTRYIVEAETSPYSGKSIWQRLAEELEDN